MRLHIGEAPVELGGEFGLHQLKAVIEEQHLVKAHFHQRHDLMARAARHDADDRRIAAARLALGPHRLEQAQLGRVRHAIMDHVKGKLVADLGHPPKLDDGRKTDMLGQVQHQCGVICSCCNRYSSAFLQNSCVRR